MSSIYRTLNSNIREIRLLELQPAPFDEQIQVKLSSTSLDDACDYEALSYRWGQADFSQEINVDGQPFRVTKNLEVALRYLRNESSPRTLWVDAICINQTDNLERNHQVTLMKDIYTHCTTDLAWLGPSPSSEDRPYFAKDDQEFTQYIIQGLELMERIAKKDKNTLTELEPNREEEGQWVLPLKKQRVLDAAFRLAPIWSRIWVMQEFSCAARVVLVAGHHTLNWDAVAGFLGDTPYSDAFHLYCVHGLLELATSHTFEFVQFIQHQRQIARDVAEGKTTSTLMDVLARFKFAQSTDRRDKIFGLLGLVSERHGITVDYNKTAEQIFAEICKFFIDSSGDLDIICQNPWQVKENDPGQWPDMPSSEDGAPDRPHTLPSWVADFTLENYSGVNDGFSALLFAQRDIFSAGSETCPVPCQVEGGVALRVKATVLDKIGKILQADYRETPYMRPRTHTIPTSAVRQWRELYLGTYQGRDGDGPRGLSIYEVTGEPANQAYWRTLVMDCKAFPIERLISDDVVNDGHEFAEILSENSSTNPDEEDPFARETLRSKRMLLRNHMHWTFTVSANGLYCMIKKGVREGDALAVLDGGKVPVVLRQAEGDSSHFVFVGTAYVHGYMDGEAKDAADKGEVKTEDILLV